MALEISRSYVPRIAVEKTIRRGIEMFEKFHGPATPEVIEKIKREVIKQANIMNQQATIKDDEGAIGSQLYAGTRRPGQ